MYNCFNNIVNSICYLTILFIFSWDKIYYIIKGKGDNPESYFYSLKLEECPLHKSYFCGCIKTKSELEVIKKYISFYKYSSQIFVIYNGKVKFIRRNNKTTVRFIINE